jgi:hypothetical protein
MRCFFIRQNKIEFVELLKPGSDDDLLRQAIELTQKNAIRFDRLEVWDGQRLVYRSGAPKGAAKDIGRA